MRTYYSQKLAIASAVVGQRASGLRSILEWRSLQRWRGSERKRSRPTRRRPGPWQCWEGWLQDRFGTEAEAWYEGEAIKNEERRKTAVGEAIRFRSSGKRLQDLADQYEQRMTRPRLSLEDEAQRSENPEPVRAP